MFYVKENRDGLTVKVELTGDNVFTACPDCGKEFSVDIEDVLSSGGDLYSTAVYCEKCSARHKNSASR